MDHLVDQYRKVLRSGGMVTKEHRDYQLCKVFGCSPASLHEVEDSLLDLYREFRLIEKEEEKLQAQRAELKRKAKSKL